MKLAIIMSDNTVIDVLDDLQDYNLEKGMARASIMEDIQERLKEIHRDYTLICKHCGAGSRGSCTEDLHMWQPIYVRIS